MAVETREPTKSTCRLVALCSDSPAFDLRALSVIIAHAVALTPPAQPSPASPSSCGASEGYDVKGDHTNAVMAALQGTGSGSLGNSAMTGNVALRGNFFGGKGSKGSKGSKKTGQSAVAAVAALTSTSAVSGGSAAMNEGTKTMSIDGTQKTRPEWYSVVENPQWGAPIVFIHQLPDADHTEDEDGGLSSSNARGTPFDFSAALQRAIEIISEDMSTSTFSATGVTSQGAEERAALGQGDGAREILVVLALHDLRSLLTLMHCRRPSATRYVDTRLIVNFVDGRRSLGSVGKMGCVTSPTTPRSRDAQSFKRAAPRENPMNSLTAGAKDADGSGALAGDGSHTLSAWIGQQEREGLIKVVTTPSGVSDAFGVACLSEAFEDGGEDKSMWVQRCVQKVVPTMHHVLRDMTRYAEWFSGRTLYQLPLIAPSPQQLQQQPQQERLSLLETGMGTSGFLRRSKASTLAPQFPIVPSTVSFLLPVSAADTPTSGAKANSSFFLFSPLAFRAEEEEDWSYYIRERMVRGQWTCVSAARALATQVTVLLARQQKPVVVHPAEEGTCPKLEVVCEHDKSLGKTSGGDVEKQASASLLLQLKQYASKRTVLTTLPPKDHANIGPTEGGKFDMTMRSPGSTKALLPSEAVENEYDMFSATTTLPVDHTMDRPTSPPSAEEVEWLTRQFVKKGFGAFTLPPERDVMGHGSLLYSRDNLNAVMTMQELLEEPLNGQMLDDGENAVDAHVLRLIDQDLRRAEEELTCDYARLQDTVAAVFGKLQVDERLQRSVERSLTSREQTHILQQMYLEAAAIHSRTSTMAYPTSSLLLSSNLSTQKLLAPTDSTKPFVGFSIRPFEEYITMAVAICRMYEFQSRFGAHLCCLLRYQIPDLFKTLDGNITALYSTHAENVHPRRRAQALMLCGIPTPQERHKRRLWCHYVSGLPSLDQFNELVDSEKLIDSCSSPTSANPSNLAHDSTARFGGSLGDCIRRRLLQNLQNTSQLLRTSETSAEKSGDAGVCRAEGGMHTVLEGRHALYPHDDSVVEVVTTSHGRMCRYVRASELSCTLHYNITHPSTATHATADASTTRIMTTTTSPVENSTSRPPSRKPLTEETAYFTTAFDDGVVFTCTPHWPLSWRTTAGDSCANEKELLSITSSVSAKAVPSRSRRTLNKHDKQRETSNVGIVDEPLGSGRRHASRHRHRGREDNDALLAMAGTGMFAGKTPRLFPVANDGSVLLWTATTEDVASGKPNTPVSPSTRAKSRIPTLAVTVAANGVTVQSEEQDGMLWITQHESSSRLAPELLRCMHVCDENATWRRTMEVEMCRVVLEEMGAVCRYFYSGVTQTLYPDGTVVTRYPMPCSELGCTPLLSETLVTPAGNCYVRHVSGDNVGRFLRLSANSVPSHSAYDSGHHCRILSRGDGVTIVHYYDGGDGEGDRRHQNDADLDANLDDDADGDGKHPFFLNNISSGASPKQNAILRVTLHADGTSITTFFDRFTQKSHLDLSAFLQPLLQQVTTVSTACGAVVKYCVEAPSLPAIFLGTSVKTDNNSVKEEKRAHAEHDAANTAALKSQKMFPVGSGGGASETTLLPSCLSVGTSQVLTTILKSDTSFKRVRPKVHDCFYILFGDGSVLQRSVVHHGRNGNVRPFLETLFTRPSQTSLRVIHESGLIVVEPAETVRRNMEAFSSLAIGEGFAMFDVAQGGLRLVDHRHYVTEVRDLYSPGSVQANITPASLETLLRQLVLPTYTPHKVTKAQREAIEREEKMANLQSRQDRLDGVCAPLATRLRELGEGFVIAHSLLRSDILNNATRQWENRSCPHETSSHVTMNVPTGACWGSSSAFASAGRSAALQDVLSSTAAAPVLSPATRTTVSHSGVIPLFFTKFDGDVVVQYLHQQSVEEYVRLKDSEMTPIFLSHGTASGEPGVRQLTFFRIETEEECGRGVAPLGSTQQLYASGSFSTTLPRHPGTLTGGQGGPVLSGSLLGGAVQRQKTLSLFSGARLSFPTARWLPPAMQPPRRFIRPFLNTHGTDKRGGVTVVSDDSSGKNGIGGSFSSYERLRTFLKFSEVTETAQHIVLSSERQLHHRLASMLVYQRSMNKLAPGIPQVAMDEQRRLREKHLAETTT